MKTKFLFAGLSAIFAFGALAPSNASADHGSSGSYVTRMVGRDDCGRPIYKKVWVPSRNSSQHSGHQSHKHGRDSRGGGNSGGGYIHAPGIDLHFGSSPSRQHAR